MGEGCSRLKRQLAHLCKTPMLQSLQIIEVAGCQMAATARRGAALSTSFSLITSWHCSICRACRVHPRCNVLLQRALVGGQQLTQLPVPGKCGSACV